ncbi:MAG TPA: SDR family oxidoreductase, partial [Acidobacteria bacterium]|nr:SDR family oxidoreductase [Acidobacteriota bacterium]
SSDRLDGLHRHPRLAADLASTADRDALVARAAAMAPLGGLVVGASRFERTPPGDEADVRPALALDLEAPLELALRLAPHMVSGARIVLFGDAGTALGWPSYPAYLAAKGGIEAAASSLAHRLGPEIVVLAVAPGAVEGAPPPPQGAIRHRTALGRMATPEEVARAILRFAALPPTVSHGRILVVDGGRRLFPPGSFVDPGSGGS